MIAPSSTAENSVRVSLSTPDWVCEWTRWQQWRARGHRRWWAFASIGTNRQIFASWLCRLHSVGRSREGHAKPDVLRVLNIHPNSVMQKISIDFSQSSCLSIKVFGEEKIWPGWSTENVVMVIMLQGNIQKTLKTISWWWRTMFYMGHLGSTFTLYLFYYLTVPVPEI